RSRQVAYPLLAEKDIHMWADLPLLVNDAKGQTGETAVESRDRFPNGRRLDLYYLEAPGIRVEQCRDANPNGGHQSTRAAVRDMIFGRPVARLCQESPSSALPHTSPEVVPKANSSDAPPLCAIAWRRTVCQARDGNPRSSRCQDSPPSRLRNTAG